MQKESDAKSIDIFYSGRLVIVFVMIFFIMLVLHIELNTDYLPSSAVLTISRDDLLGMIRKEKRVVFVDAREAEEFEEGHIPGAINLTLRDIGHASLEKLRSADLVVAYCLKDFRGYELARRLHGAGIYPVGIMQPFGLKGWKDHGLPVATSEFLSEFLAQARLERCAVDFSICQKRSL